MTDKTILPQESIMNKIYLIRERRVMLDRDLAKLFDVKAIRLREQVKRNEERFPENFMFRLSEEETKILVSQNAIPSFQHLGGALPYVFTEHGILQLSNVLRTGRAIQMSIMIIEVFVKMREMVLTHKDLILKLEELSKKVSGHEAQIALIFEYLKQFEKAKQEEFEYKTRTKIGFKSSKAK